MNRLMTRHATALLLILIAGLAGCGDGSGDDSSATNPAAPTAARKSAHTLEELQAKGTRASQHHTVYVELKHPGSNEPGKSRRSIPYRFDHPTRQTVCMDTNILHGHSVEIRASGSTAPALAVISIANPCQTVQFDQGDYEAVVQHSGTGATDEVTHVFAHAGFVPASNESAFGQWLARSNAVTAGAARDATGRVRKLDAEPHTCRPIEAIALKVKNSNAFLSTDLPANQMALFELRNTAQTALSSNHPSPVVADSNLMQVYACGDLYNLKFQIPGGRYLKSQCGYPLFSADTIDEATEYTAHWDPDNRRLDLVNSETGKLLRSVDRARGLVVDPGTHFAYDTQPSIGTCANYPSELQTHGPAFFMDQWTDESYDGTRVMHRKLSFRSRPALMVAEFDHNKLGELNLEVQILDSIVALPPTASFEAFDVGRGNLTEFNYPADIDVTGGFIPHQQEVMVFSFGSCQNCDLTGLDFSNRTMAALDLRGSTIVNASFVNANVLSARMDNAVISGTDFTNARFQSVSFEGARISPDPGTGVKTTFDRTVLASAAFPSNFKGTTINGAVFKSLDLTGSQWAYATVSNSSFDAVTLDGADLSHSSLSHNTHTGGSIVGTVFDDSSVTGVTLVVAQARNSSFRRSLLSGFRVSNADFTYATFNGSTIKDSTFNYVYAVGADFSSTTWTTSSFEHVQAYSDGASVTHFDGCTVVSGSFSNSLFMQSSFNNCRFQGGSFSGSQFVASTFQGATSSSDSTQSQLSFDQALLAGADFSNATFNAGDLTNAIISTKAGNVDLTIRTSPYVSETSPGASITRSYNYAATLKPASTGTGTTCPNSLPGPCATDAAWKPVNPPRYAGHEDPDSW